MSKQKKNPIPKPNQAESKADAPLLKTSQDSSYVAQNWAIPLVLGALAFLLYANTLGHAYVLDDDLALRLHKYVPEGINAIGKIFTAPYRDGCFGGCLYRPIPLSLFAIEWQIAPNSAALNHFMNVAWFAATGMLLFGTLRRLMPGYSPLLALCAALLFLVHPVHTEVVANVKSRDEILCFFFILLSINWFSRTLPVAGLKGRYTTPYTILSIFAFLCALLSKESALTALPVFPLLAYFFYGKSLGQSLRSSWFLLIAVAVFFALRGSALSGLTAPAVSYMDNPIMAAKDMGQRLGTAFAVLGKYMGLLVAPVTLNSDYTYNSFPVVGLGDIKALLSMLFHLGLLGLAVWQWPRRHIISFCILAYFAAMSLYSQIPVRIGTLMGERLLFTPSFWFCLSLPVLIFMVLKINILQSESKKMFTLSNAEKIAVGIVLFISILFALKTLDRNKDWKNNLTLFTTDVAKSPESVRLNDGAAEELYKSLGAPETNPNDIEQIWQRSNQHSEKSLSLEPKSLSALLNMGNLRFYKKEYEAAARYYEKALEVMPDYSFAKRNLVSLLIEWARKTGEKDNDPVKARALLERAVALDKDNAAAWHLLGISYAVQNDLKKAYEMFQRATKLEPDNTTYSADVMRTMQALGMMSVPKAPK